MESVEENAQPNELMPGDLLFSVVTAGGVEYVAHALIYAPNDEYPLLPVVHAVSNERKDLYRVMATSLPEGNYRVFRCQNQTLSQKAAEQAVIWSQYHTPYDQDRKNLQNSVTAQLDALAERSDSEPNSEFRLRHQRKFADDNLPLNAIKYASRREGPLTLPKDSQLGHGAGVRCSMFAAICYQASAVADHVTPNPPGTWSSNKHADADQMPKDKLTRLSVKEIRRFSGSRQNKRLSAKFQDAVQNAEEYKKINIIYSEDRSSRAENHPRYRPAVLNWKSEQFPAIAKFNFKEAVTPGLYFDQKTIDIKDMVQSLKNDSEHWEERPRLHVPKKEPTQEEKTAYAEQVSSFLEKADDNTQRFTQALKAKLGLNTDNVTEAKDQEIAQYSPGY